MEKVILFRKLNYLVTSFLKKKKKKKPIVISVLQGLHSFIRFRLQSYQNCIVRKIFRSTSLNREKTKKLHDMLEVWKNTYEGIQTGKILRLTESIMEPYHSLGGGRNLIFIWQKYNKTEALLLKVVHLLNRKMR